MGSVGFKAPTLIGENKMGEFPIKSKKEIGKKKLKVSQDVLSQMSEQKVRKLVREIITETKKGDIEGKVRMSFLMSGWKMPKRQFKGLIKLMREEFGKLADEVINHLLKYGVIEKQGSSIIWND